MRIVLGGNELVLDPTGAVWWPQRRTLIVADLHLEKGSAYARRGSFLPPYDSQATLARLEAVMARLEPDTVVSLGDGFHDRRGPAALSPDLFDRLTALVRGVRWVWVTGNHDPCIPEALGGACMAACDMEGLRLTHIPTGAEGELAGHLHPKARVSSRRLRLSRPCFAGDAARLVLPAFGVYSGGLNALDPAVAGLFPRGFAAYLLGEERVFAVPHDRLVPESDPLRYLLEPHP